jgi:hypothetical protein
MFSSFIFSLFCGSWCPEYATDCILAGSPLVVEDLIYIVTAVPCEEGCASAYVQIST